MNRHPHPFWIWDRLKPLRPLLLIPVLRILAGWLDHAPPTDLLRDAFFGGTAAVLLRGILQTVTYRTDGRIVSLRERFPFDRRQSVLLRHTVSVDTERQLLAALTGGRRVRICVGGGRPFFLYLDRSSTQPFLPPLHPKRRGRLPAALLWALSGSDAAVGWLYAILPLRQTARLLGKRAAAEWITLKDRLLMQGLPALLTALAILAAVGWLFSFFRRLAVGMGFSVEQTDGEWQTQSGLLLRQYCRLFCSETNGILLRQTLGLSLCGLYSVAAVVDAGGRRLGHDRPVICQMAAKRDIAPLLSALCPFEPPSEPILRPDRRGRRRYWLPPLLWSLPAGVLLLLGPAFRPAGGLWLVCSFWWLIVRLRAGHTGGIARTEAAVLLCFPQKLSLSTVILPLRGEESLLLRQSPLQKHVGLCDVTVCVGGGRFRVRALRIDEVRRLFPAARSAP